jgi:hypothetical protein
MEIALTMTLSCGIIAKLDQMVPNVVFLLLNAKLILVVMTKILVPKIFACQSMVSAETLQDVMTTMNVPTTSALLLPTENLILVLILLVLVLRIQTFSMLTLSYSPTNKNSSGWENVTRILDALPAY